MFPPNRIIAAGMLFELVACTKASPPAGVSVAPEAAAPATAESAPATASPVTAADAAATLVPLWALALQGRAFPFASREHRGTLRFLDAPAKWSKDRSFVWFDVIDDVTYARFNQRIDVLAVGGSGLDVACVLLEAAPSERTAGNPETGHKAKMRLGCPADAREIDFRIAIPLTLKWDAAAGSWSSQQVPE